MKRKIALAIFTAMLIGTSPVMAENIEYEPATIYENVNADEFVRNIISDIVDEAEVGNIGYTLAAGYANARIRKAVIAGESDGYGYGVLSPIAQNMIRESCVKQPRCKI